MRVTKEFAQVMQYLQTAYKTFHVRDHSEVLVWYDALKDIDPQTLKIAVRKLTAESPYPPTIHDIRKRATESGMESLPDASEGWGELQSAIRFYGSYREAEALESMSPLTKKIAKRMGFKNLCQSENHMVDRSHFIKLYNSLVEEEKRESYLPEDVKQQIESKRKENREKIDYAIKNLLEEG